MKLRQSIYGKMIAKIILFLVIPFILVTANLIYLVSSDLGDSYESMIDLSVEQVRSNRSLHVNNVHDIAIRVSENNILKGFLLVPYTHQNLNYYRSQIAPIVESDVADTYRYDVRIFSANRSISRGFGSFYHMSDISGEQVDRFLASDEQTIWVYPTGNQGFQSPFVDFPGQYTYLKKVNVNNELLYLLAISVSIREMDVFTSEHVEATEIFRDQPLITYGDAGQTLLVDYSTDVGAHELRQVEIDGIPQVLQLVYPKNDHQAKLLLFFFASIIFIIGLALFVLVYVRQIFNSIYAYLQAFNDSSANGYQNKLAVTGDDEITRLAKVFNAQIDKIQQLIEITSEQAALVKESEIKALHQQINPHFIYNTFETFSYRMELHNLYEEADAMISFSNMLRYNMSGSEAFSTLRMELAQVDDFFNIQRLKYENITFDVNVPLDLYDQVVPRFLLQPIIENCFVHGYYNQDMYIMLNVWYSEGYVHFEVFDDGKGIPEPELDAINDALNTGHDQFRVGIGLSNINRRLRLFYSDECKIMIHSKAFSWTILYWQIPYDPKPAPLSLMEGGTIHADNFDPGSR